MINVLLWNGDAGARAWCVVEAAATTTATTLPVVRAVPMAHVCYGGHGSRCENWPADPQLSPTASTGSRIDVAAVGCQPGGRLAMLWLRCFFLFDSLNRQIGAATSWISVWRCEQITATRNSTSAEGWCARTVTTSSAACVSSLNTMPEGIHKLVTMHDLNHVDLVRSLLQLDSHDEHHPLLIGGMFIVSSDGAGSHSSNMLDPHAPNRTNCDRWAARCSMMLAAYSTSSM